MTLSALFEQIEVPLDDDDLRATRRCTSAARCRSTAASCCTGRSATGSRRSRSSDDLGLTTSKDVLEAVGARRRPAATSSSRSATPAGRPGQLEQELAQNAWLTVEADPDVHRSTCRPRRALPAAMRLLGIDFSRLSDDVGHA